MKVTYSWDHYRFDENYAVFRRFFFRIRNRKPHLWSYLYACSLNLAAVKMMKKHIGNRITATTNVYRLQLVIIKAYSTHWLYPLCLKFRKISKRERKTTTKNTMRSYPLGTSTLSHFHPKQKWSKCHLNGWNKKEKKTSCCWHAKT